MLIPCFNTILHFHPYILQHFKWNLLFRCFLIMQTCLYKLHLSMKCRMHVQRKKMIYNKKEFVALYGSYTKVKDHVHKGMESFYVKTKKSTCATFAVGQFNWIRRRWTKVWFGQFLQVIVAIYLCILRVLVGKETLIEYMYVSKRACNCHIWDLGVLSHKNGYVGTILT